MHGTFHNMVLLYLPECREILWFSDGSAAAAGYGGYYGGYGGYGGGYGEISTFVTCEKKKISLVCSSVCLSKHLSVCCSFRKFQFFDDFDLDFEPLTLKINR